MFADKLLSYLLISIPQTLHFVLGSQDC